MKKLLVTGGTGTLGKTIVKKLLAASHDVRVLTRNRHSSLPAEVTVCEGDLSNWTHLQEFVRGVDTIIHCASNPRDARVTDIEGTRNLLQAIDGADHLHLIYVSIVGVDRSDYRYYQAKFEVENMIATRCTNWSIVRATQFHDLVLERLIKPFDKGSPTPLRIPGRMRFQSIDVRDVANILGDIAKGRAIGSVITLRGPEVLTIEEMSRQYLSALGRNDRIEPGDIPGEMYELFRSGINICENGEVGKITWRSFLEQRAHTVSVSPNAKF